MGRTHKAVVSGRPGVTIGLCTQDFSRVYDLVRILHEREIDYSLIAPGEVVDRVISVAIVEGPAPIFIGNKPKTMKPLKDPVNTVDRAIAISLGVFRPGKMTFGVDPGLRVGMATLADGVTINTSVTMDAGSIPKRMKSAKSAIRPTSSVVRIGNGDPKSRDEIIALMCEAGERIEVVDERSTSLGSRRSHEEAAVRIARMKGQYIDCEAILRDSRR